MKEIEEIIDERFGELLYPIFEKMDDLFGFSLSVPTKDKFKEIMINFIQDVIKENHEQQK